MKKNSNLYAFLGLSCVLTILLVVSCGKVIPVDQAPDDALRSGDPGAYLRGFGKFPKQTTPTDSVPLPIGGTDTTVIPPPIPPPPPPAPFPVIPSTGCSFAPTYGDSIIFPQPTGGSDYVVSPNNNPGTGKYYSWPVGLAIDSITGVIDLTKSQTGLRYDVGFVKSGTSDTCINQLIVGGADYMDSVYVIDNGSTTALPYYDANPLLASPCASGNGCTFDVTGSAAAKKVIVDKNTGVIDLQKTLTGSGLLGGAFGPLPLNGMNTTATIYYRLNDASNLALQRIDVEVMYYGSKSQVPPGLLNSLTSVLGNILSGHLISTTSINPRPPLIIIVRHN